MAHLAPLQQLSALTHLTVYNMHADAAAFVGTAAQLTGLKHLKLLSYCATLRLPGISLVQLTALTALELLEVDLRQGNELW